MVNGETPGRRPAAGLISSKLAAWGASRQALWQGWKGVPLVPQWAQTLVLVLVLARTPVQMQMQMQVQVQVQALMQAQMQA